MKTQNFSPTSIVNNDFAANKFNVVGAAHGIAPDTPAGGNVVSGIESRGCSAV